MPEELALLAATAAAIGVVHTLLGPDHYVPFIAMARARGWTLRRTMTITLACGAGHVLGSVLLGAAGIALGWAVGMMSWWEGARGDLAAWLLLGVGLAYTAWGIRYAVRRRPHTHVHTHADGTEHVHVHSHFGEHSHVHDRAHGRGRRPEHLRPRASLTAWALFLVFVLGPCEPLIPLLMVPAARTGLWGVALVATIFAVATLATMAAVTAVGVLGLGSVRLGPWERYVHVVAGVALVACGLAMTLGL